MSLRLGVPWKPGTLFGGDCVTVGGTAAGGTGWHVEQWVRMLVAVVIAVIALSNLDYAALRSALLGRPKTGQRSSRHYGGDGGLQILVFGLAVLLSGTAGTGVFFSKR